MAEGLELKFLGDIQILQGGKPLTGFVSAKARALLCYLAVTGQAHRRPTLAGLLWGEQPEPDALANLRKVLSNLRHLLGPHLIITPHQIAFDRHSSYWMDVETFCDRVRRLDASPGQAWPAYLQEFKAAVELYRGDFLAGFYVRGATDFEEWAAGQRERFRQLALQALHTLANYHAVQRDYSASLECVSRLLTMEPWREEAHRQKMLLLAWMGQPSAAMEQYKVCRQALQLEFGIEPGAETNSMFEQIRAGQLDALAPPPAFLQSMYPDFAEQAPVARRAFVARERELAQLDEHLDSALAGQGRVVFVTGEAGQGKTALVQEFVQRAIKAHPRLVATEGNGNAYTGIGAPYLLFRQALNLLAGDIETHWSERAMPGEQARRLWRLLPLTIRALVDAGPDLVGDLLPGAALLKRAAAAKLTAPGETAWLRRLEELVASKSDTKDTHALQTSYLFDQYTSVLQMLARQNPLLIVLDDLQWADTGSLGLLFHLGRQIENSHILIVGVFRPAELAVGTGGPQTLSDSTQPRRHPLASMVNEFKRRFGDIDINLDRAEDCLFVSALLDAEPNQLGADFREALYQRTGGQPLFTVELLQIMRERGELTLNQEGQWVQGPALDWERLPARVEAVIAERIDRLPEPLRQLLQVACVQGQDFSARVVACAHGKDEQETLNRLEQDLDGKHRLICAAGSHLLGARYRFQHIMFQKYLYAGLAHAERARLHGAVGTTMETLCQDPEEMAAAAPQLAWHMQEAGLAERAVGYLHMAGDRARRLYALPEAIGYYQRAIECLKKGDAQEQMARTLMKLGLTFHLAFDFLQARQSYEQGFALWQQVARILPPTAPQADGCLRVDCPYPPLSLDPALAGDIDSTSVLDQLFSGLVELSHELEIMPDIAASWEVLEGGREYVFHLRTDARWSDGTPVTARDFEYAWKRVLNPATGSPVASMLYEIKGARALHQGEIQDADKLGVRALDKFTLAVELEQPAGHLLYLLAYTAAFPVPSHVVKSHASAWTDPGNIVTNGPFCLESYRPDEMLTLIRNPGYTGRFTGNVQRVELRPVADVSARLAAYEADQLDILFLWTHSQERASARQRHASEYLVAPWLATTYVGFDTSRPPFNDLNVRRAFALAADKETFANVVLQGYAFPATGGFVPPGMAGHSASIGLPHDPDQAHTFLAQAGYPEGRGFPPVQFISDESSSQALAAQWQETLGVEIAWSKVSWEEFVQRLENDPPNIFLGTWQADYADPDNFTRVCEVIRWTRWRNDGYWELVEKARQVMNQAERLAMYHQADHTLVQEVALLPITYRRLHMLLKPWVRRFPTSAIKWWYWKDVVIEPNKEDSLGVAVVDPSPSPSPKRRGERVPPSLVGKGARGLGLPREIPKSHKE